MLWSSFQQPHISANRGMAVERSLPPKTRTINCSDWSSHSFAVKRLGSPSTHVQSHFTYECLSDHHIDAVDARQIHSCDGLQFIGEMEVRIILVLFTLLFLGYFFLRL